MSPKTRLSDVWSRVLLMSWLVLGGLELSSAVPEEITIGGLFPMIWAEEAECAGHLLAAVDRINNKTDGYLDHLLPEVSLDTTWMSPSRRESFC